MRIVGGTRRGRRLRGPRSAAIRPTQDRVRETLFNVLGQSFDGGQVLDLYAGTGAFGLEALSRGAARAVLVDSGAEAAALCRRNAAELGLLAETEVVQAPVARALERLAADGRRFELVFADPPYQAGAGARVVEAAEPVLAEGGTLVVEHDRREPLPERAGALVLFDERRFGDTRASLYRRAAANP